MLNPKQVLSAVLEEDRLYLEENIRRRLRMGNYPEELFTQVVQEGLLIVWDRTPLGPFYILNV